MKKLNCIVLVLVSVMGASTFAKSLGQVPYSPNSKSSALSEKNLVEELTGKKASTELSASELRKAPLSVQHYVAGQRAAGQKNYILAIKHFNTVIQKYPRSQQVASSLLAKAQIYKEMGLQPQAERNLKLAQLQKNTNLKPLAKTQDKNKIIK